MDIVVTGRHIQVSDRFREHLEDKLAKVAQVAPKVTRLDVVVTHERNARNSESVELTCRERGAVVRAESSNEDKYVAFDQAIEKLVERLRRAGDKRRAAVRSRRAAPTGASNPGLVGVAPTADDHADAVAEQPEVNDSDGIFGAVGDSPIEVREKVHPSHPMTLAEAVNQMELVGHDFYLFNDADTGKASVVYRRRGWSYGVIHLEPVPTPEST